MAFSRPCLTAAKSHIRVIVTNSLKNIAVGPDRSPVRAWRAWGERAMPVPNGVPPAKLLRRFRGKPPRWLFGEQARPPLMARMGSTRTVGLRLTRATATTRIGCSSGCAKCTALA